MVWALSPKEIRLAKEKKRAKCFVAEHGLQDAQSGPPSQLLSLQLYLVPIYKL
jgi:hypothetical protein